MGVQLVYPATETQAQTIINKIDAVDAKIVTPNYQDKTVTPSDVQQTVQADNGYNALHSVTVEPIAAAMPQGLEEFIMDDGQSPHSLSLNGAIPAYACYNKTHLKAVYGNITSVGENAFYNCTSLQSIELLNTTSLEGHSFENCSSLLNINAPNLTTILGKDFFNTTGVVWADLRSLTEFPAWQISAFEGSSIKFLDLRKLSGIKHAAFISCANLSLLDFTDKISPIELTVTTAFNGTNNNWIAVVANDTVKAAFQSATNWSTYASHFRTIAEVEQETGMSYDDYYYQCFGHARN